MKTRWMATLLASALSLGIIGCDDPRAAGKEAMQEFTRVTRKAKKAIDEARDTETGQLAEKTAKKIADDAWEFTRGLFDGLTR